MTAARMPGDGADAIPLPASWARRIRAVRLAAHGRKTRERRKLELYVRRRLMREMSHA